MPGLLTDFFRRPDVITAAAVVMLRAVTLASRFLLSILLARMLTVAEFGQYGLITAVLAFALLAVGLEFYTFTLRQIVPAEPSQRVRIIADQIILTVLMLCLAAFVVAVAVWSGIFPLGLAPWFLLILLTEHLSLEATRILIIISRPVRAYIGVFLRGGIWVFAIAILMFAEPSSRTLEMVLLWWALGGIAAVLFAAASMIHLPWSQLRGYRPDPAWIWGGLRTALPFMLTAISALTLTYFDRFVIEGYHGSEALGIYTFYSTIAIGILGLATSVSHQFLPKVIAGFAAGATAYRTVLRMYAWSLGVSAAAVVTIGGIAIWPMVALLDLHTYAAGLAAFYVMLVGVFVRILADVPSYALYAARADIYLLAANLGAAAVSIVLNLLLIPTMGLMGAACANAAASGTLFVTLALLAWRRLDSAGPELATIDLRPEAEVFRL